MLHIAFTNSVQVLTLYDVLFITRLLELASNSWNNSNKMNKGIVYDRNFVKECMYRQSSVLVLFLGCQHAPWKPSKLCWEWCHCRAGVDGKLSSAGSEKSSTDDFISPELLVHIAPRRWISACLIIMYTLCVATLYTATLTYILMADLFETSYVSFSVSPLPSRASVSFFVRHSPLHTIDNNYYLFT